MGGGEWDRMDWLPVWTDIEIENMDFWLLNPLMAPAELFWSTEWILPTSWIIDLPDLQSHGAQSCCQVCSFCYMLKIFMFCWEKAQLMNDSYFLLSLALPLHKIWYTWALAPKLSCKFRSLVYQIHPIWVSLGSCLGFKTVRSASCLMFKTKVSLYLYFLQKEN